MFDQMVRELTFPKDMSIPEQIDVDPETFKDLTFKSITEHQLQQFLKESIFEKLKGKKLGTLFLEKFNVRDRVLSIYSDDQDVINHIRYCKYVK